MMKQNNSICYGKIAIVSLKTVSFVVYRKLYNRHRIRIFFLLLFAAFLFLRFYQLPERAYLGWDQADSAWAAKSILYDHPIRLNGVPIKGNAEMYMGPLYYYLITPFYFITRLDMIASPIFASTVSVLSFFLFYYITRKLFDQNTTFIALFIYTVSMLVITSDRLQAAFILIPIMSYVVIYCLYKVLTGSERYLLYLAAIVGFGFHVHFTAVFYLLLILLTVPLFPRTRKTILYGVLGGAILLLFLSPLLYSMFFMKSAGSNGILTYLHASYHGFHIKRVLQLTGDGLISFALLLQFSVLKPLSYLLLPVFIYLYGMKSPKKFRRDHLVLTYVIVLMVVIPWLAFATYNGELTDYYFSHARYLAIAVIAFLLAQVYMRKELVGKIAVFILLFMYAGYNVYLFFHVFPGNYLTIKHTVESAVQTKQIIRYKERDPISYMYYVYTHYRDK